MKTTTRSLSIWTVYDHPTDFPNCFVARRFELETPTSDVMLSDDLEGLRRVLASRGLVCMRRHPNDDAKIVETWL